MKKRLLSVVLCTFFSFALSAQIQGYGGDPRSSKISFPKDLPSFNFAQPDIAQLRMEDSITEITKVGPWRFGFNNEVSINLENAGKWYNLPNGGKVWMVRLHCNEALTINLTFENLTIPEGNELYVYNEDKSFILGKFTANHVYEGQLGTELIPGSTAIVEYYVSPKNQGNIGSLTIDKVTHGYRTSSEFANKAFGGSGSCNMNVNCPDGDDWADEKRSVVMLVSGSNGFCTGALVNNTAYDGKPYILTANHCYNNNLATWVFRFHWESPTCTNPVSSPTNFQSLSGAILRARRTPSDFCLVEITGGLSNGTIPESMNPYFAGWDNSGVNPTSTVGIHHPSGDIKKISFDDNASTPVQAMSSTEANSSWSVQWDRNTTTEGGSSGSPLFDQNHRIIGQLWGGSASCSNLTGKDFYGRFHNSWQPTGSNSTNQLKHWLDPLNSGATTVDGYDPNAVSVTDDAGIQTITSPIGTYCQTTVDPVVVLKNYGANELTSVDIIYGATGVPSQTYNWTGNLAAGASETINLPTLTVINGASTFSVETSNPNGVADNNTVNDVKTTSISAVANGLPIAVTINTDCYGYEISWRIVDENSAVVMSGGNQMVVPPGGQRISNSSGQGAYGNASTNLIEGCLPEGCYTFTIYDDYGDGLSTTSSWSCTAPNAGYFVNDGEADVVTMTSANFGASASHQFCLGDASPADPCESATTIVLQTNSTASSGSNGTAGVTVTGGVDPYTYSWTGSNGFASSNQNLSGLAPGNYTVTVTDYCGNIQTATVVVESSVGIKDNSMNNFAVYPNPSTGKFTIEFSQQLNEAYTISVLDLTGRVVYRTTDSVSKKQIDLNNVANGKYILNVKSNTGSRNHSIVIR